MCFNDPTTPHPSPLWGLLLSPAPLVNLQLAFASIQADLTVGKDNSCRIPVLTWRL